MTSSPKTLVAVLILACAGLVAGCSTRSPKQSSIPWSQPASWEGQIPGMQQAITR